MNKRFFLHIIIFLALILFTPSVVRACGPISGIPTVSSCSAGRPLLCYSEDSNSFACCHPTSDTDCTYLIGDVREGFTAGECADTSAYLKKLPDYEDQSLSYIAVFKQCVNLAGFLNQAILWAVVLGGALAIVRLAMGSWQYAASTGDPTKLEEARGVIVFAVVGLLIIGTAYLILKLGDEFIPESWRVWFGTD